MGLKSHPRWVFKVLKYETKVPSPVDFQGLKYGAEVPTS